MSGVDPDDEELEEVEELERLTSLADQSLWTRIKKMVLDLVERVGFFGILVCASVSKNGSQLFIFVSYYHYAMSHRILIFNRAFNTCK